MQLPSDRGEQTIQLVLCKSEEGKEDSFCVGVENVLGVSTPCLCWLTDVVA